MTSINVAFVPEQLDCKYFSNYHLPVSYFIPKNMYDDIRRLILGKSSIRRVLFDHIGQTFIFS